MVIRSATDRDDDHIRPYSEVKRFHQLSCSVSVVEAKTPRESGRPAEPMMLDPAMPHERPSKGLVTR